MENEARASAGVQEISYPRFAAFYNRMMGQPLVRRMFDPLRREIVGQAERLVLEVGAGRGPPVPRRAFRYCYGHARLLFGAGSGARPARDLAGAQAGRDALAARTCARARTHYRVGTGCARAPLDPLHGPLPLEPRYGSDGGARGLPGHAGAPAQRRTPADAASAHDAFPGAGGDARRQGITPFCSE